MSHGSAGGGMQALSKEERQRLAVRKLSRLFQSSSSRPRCERAAEIDILREVLRRTNQEDIAKLVEYRLAAINTREEDSDSSSDDNSIAGANGSPPGRRRVAASEPRKDCRIPAACAGKSAPDISAAQVLKQLAHGSIQVPQAFLSQDFWRMSAGGWLGDLSAAAPLNGTSAVIAPSDAELPTALMEAKAQLRMSGYCAVEASPHSTAAMCDTNSAEAIYQAMERLCTRGWPPVFIFMFDELWQLIDRAFVLAAELLDVDSDMLFLEPSMFAWALLAPGEGRPRVGDNFGLPHRDYTAQEALHSGGQVRLLSVWVPLNDTTLDNGCMYVLPREADILWDRSEHPAHMRCASSLLDYEAGTHSGDSSADEPPSTELRFPVQSIRPLPAKAGSMLCWAGNTVHWGAACMAGRPRRSVAFTLKVGTEPLPEGALGCSGSEAFPYISREESSALGRELRFRLCCRAMLLYSKWFDMPHSVLPGDFWSALYPGN